MLEDKYDVLSGEDKWLREKNQHSFLTTNLHQKISSKPRQKAKKWTVKLSTLIEQKIGFTGTGEEHLDCKSNSIHHHFRHLQCVGERMKARELA